MKIQCVNLAKTAVISHELALVLNRIVCRISLDSVRSIDNAIDNNSK